MIDEKFKYLLFHQMKAVLSCCFSSYMRCRKVQVPAENNTFWSIEQFHLDRGWVSFYKNRFYDMCFLYGQLFLYSMDVADMDGRKWILVIVNHKPPVLSLVVHSFVEIQLQQIGNIIQDPNNNLRRANNYITISVLAD